MAVDGLELVSLDRIKTELRFPADDTDHDDFLKELVRSAASFIAADLHVPLVDVQAYRDVKPSNTPIVIVDRFAKDVVSVRQQDSSKIEGYYPNEIDSKTYTKHAPATDDWLHGRIIINHTFDPDRLYRVIYTRGIQEAYIKRYQPLIVLMVRAAYNGESMTAPNSAYERMAAILKDYTFEGTT